MAHQQPMKILVTGFGPFPGCYENPSEDLVRQLALRRLALAPEITLQTAIIPTSWAAIERFVAEDLPAFDPDIALHFGVASRARGFRIEHLAHNTANTAADCEGKRFTRSRLTNETPSKLHATIDAEKVVQQLRRRGLEACVSRNAGRYICNMLLYLSLAQSEGRKLPRETGFIHIPPLRGCPHHAGDLAMADLLTGTQIILNHCIGVQRRLNRLHRRAA